MSCLDPGCTPPPQSRVCSLEPRPSGDLGSNTSSGPHMPGDPELTASPRSLRLLPRQMGVWPADLSEPSGSGPLGGPQGCSRGGSWGPIARLLLGEDSCPSHQEGQSGSRSGGEEKSVRLQLPFINCMYVSVLGLDTLYLNNLPAEETGGDHKSKSYCSWSPCSAPGNVLGAFPKAGTSSSPENPPSPGRQACGRPFRAQAGLPSSAH